MGRLNKPAKPNYPYRSPNQTNAEDLAPNLLEDVGASQAADMRRIGRGLSPDATPGHKFSEVNRRRQQEAGGRAALRSLGRAGALGAAAEVGEAVGRELDRRNPKVGEAAERMIEGSGVGSLMRRGAVPSGRVEFSDEAEQEFANQDVERAMRVARERSDEEREERRVKTDRERALRTGAKEGYASGGFVRKADGIAQRGKTRGRFV
jgi:hypothetical protein